MSKIDEICQLWSIDEEYGRKDEFDSYRDLIIKVPLLMELFHEAFRPFNWAFITAVFEDKKKEEKP